LLERILADLNKTPGIIGSLISGKDGLPIAHAVPPDIDVELVCAMASAVFGTSERSAGELKQGELDRVMIESGNGKTLIVDAGEGILVVLTKPDVNLGLIRLEMKRASQEIKSLI